MRLYKFLHPDRTDVLERSRIRFTPPTALNDPFELRPFFENIVTPSQLIDRMAGQVIDIDATCRQVYAELPEDVRARVTYEAMMELMRPHFEGDALQETFANAFALMDQVQRQATPKAREAFFGGLAKVAGILSLTEDVENPTMWAHYAADHRGFALQFDATHEFFNRRRSQEDEFYHLRQVVYRDPPISYESLLDKAIEAALVTKGTSWRHEREWRILAPLEHANEVVSGIDGPIHLFDLPPTAVTGIVVGARASDEIRARLVALGASSRYEHSRLAEARLDPRGLVLVAFPD